MVGGGAVFALSSNRVDPSRSISGDFLAIVGRALPLAFCAADLGDGKGLGTVLPGRLIVSGFISAES